LRLLLAGNLPILAHPGATATTVAVRTPGAEQRQKARVDDIELRSDQARADLCLLNDLNCRFPSPSTYKSNTIIYAKDLATVGIGAGQMSLVVRRAIPRAGPGSATMRARRAPDQGILVSPPTRSPVAYAFWPASRPSSTAGSPGGSIRDDEVIKAGPTSTAINRTMVFPRVRQFPD